MDHYVPMTPELRRGAIASIDEKIREIKTCEDTPWTNMYLNAYEIQKNAYQCSSRRISGTGKR